MHIDEDLKATAKMSFKQIIDICDLILEAENLNTTTILTIRDVEENGSKHLEKLENTN